VWRSSESAVASDLPAKSEMSINRSTRGADDDAFRNAGFHPKSMPLPTMPLPDQTESRSTARRVRRRQRTGADQDADAWT